MKEVANEKEEEDDEEEVVGDGGFVRSSGITNTTSTSPDRTEGSR